MIREVIHKLAARENLSKEESYDTMNEIMSGNASEAQTAAFLMGLRLKGETVDEIAGCARSMREKAVPIRTRRENIIDTCGTGGDGSGTFNISTCAAIIASSAGAVVAKHGNRAVSSQSGSADVLRELGVNLDITPERTSEILDGIGITFLFAPQLHGAMKFAVPVRREMGIRTIFNVLGPLTNPAGARRQVVGVFDPALTKVLAEVLRDLGSEHALVVHGEGGIDEFSTLGSSHVSELKDGHVTSYEISAEDLGIAKATAADLRGGDSKRNAEIINGVLNGRKGPARDIAVLNAAAALLVSGISTSVEEGIAEATKAIDDGSAAAKLQQWIRATNGRGDS
ncbi:MAG: anthranilate phosphoribosyltransferase [Ignavibacteriales bacterium]|nr:anthranilate phosphoribosyltransferase [Ignavibacteriales bacterium]